MKKILITLISVLSFLSSRAQHPDSTAIASERQALQQKKKEIQERHKYVRNSISALKQEYKDQERDSAFHAKLAALRVERGHWGREHRAWGKQEATFAKHEEVFDKSLMVYYRTQPFIKYNRRSGINMAIGIGFVSAGGVAFLTGLGYGMAEMAGNADPGVVEAFNRQRRTRFMVCFASALTAGLISIPFFRASAKNKTIFKRHIALNLQMDPIILPNGLAKETIGFNLRIPMFAQTGNAN